MTKASLATTSFSVDRLLRQACEETDLSDFGDDAFREPFEVLVNALESEAKLHAIGRQTQHDRLLNILKNRLRTFEYIRLYPEILDEDIVAPVAIVGLPRTGTTMLHRVLASDKRFFAPLWYEVRNPAPFMDWNPREIDYRVTVATEEVAALLKINPEIAAIHPLDPIGADEDILLLEHSFYSTVPNAFCNVPSYAQWLFSHDNQPGYDYLKMLLQSLQWQKKRCSGTADNLKWLLKTPHHLHFIDHLLHTFTDVRIIQTHRDPIDTIPSISSFNYNLWITQSDDVDASLVGKQWSEIFAAGMRHTCQVREHCNNLFIDIGFKELFADPVAVTTRILDFIGVPATQKSLQTMQTHHEENKRDLRPAHQYRLEDFGFTETGLHAQFGEYYEKFGRYL